MPIGPGEPPPIVDVTIRMIEGKQFFVNRITFTGQHDDARQRRAARDARATRAASSTRRR